jgi:hypothetical protein
MEIQEESERVDLFRIHETPAGEPAVPDHRVPPDARELGKLSGSGSPLIVAAWFARWSLRPTVPRLCGGS